MTAHGSRRRFLATAAAGLLAAPARAASALIDTHIHLYDPTRPQGVPWPPKTDSLLYRPVLPAEYEALVRPLGVTGAIVVEASPWLEDNQWVLDLAADHRIVVGVVGHLDPGAADFRANLARFAKNRLFRGIRLNGQAIVTGLTSPRFVDDLRRLAGDGLMLDAIGNAPMIAALLSLTDRVPDLRVVVDHTPGEPVNWHTARTAFAQLAARPRVYAKVSGVLQLKDAYRQGLDEIWSMFGENRVIYGSNWPVSGRVGTYEEVLRAVREYVAAKGAQASETFFAGNAKECYGWIHRA